MRTKLKASAQAFDCAADLMRRLLDDSFGKLGDEPGDTYAEEIFGYRFLATRRYCGGVFIREIGSSE